VLRKLLGTETSILSCHYMYQHLEAALYRSRNAFASALGEYDEACRLHDAEMDAIRMRFPSGAPGPVVLLCARARNSASVGRAPPRPAASAWIVTPARGV